MRGEKLKNYFYVAIALSVGIFIVFHIANSNSHRLKSATKSEHRLEQNEVKSRRILSVKPKHEPASSKRTGSRRSQEQISRMQAKMRFPHREKYDFIINNRSVCSTTGRLHDGVFLLTVIETAPQNFEQRLQFRQTWGSKTQFKGEQIRILFLTGRTSNDTTQQLLTGESDKYKDIIQADFQDSYLNLTLKTVLTLRWTQQYCPKALYLLKSDDDMIVRFDKIVEYLYNLPWKLTPRLYMGTLLLYKKPFRTKGHKFFVSYEEWPDKDYPTYISGPAYVMGHNAVRELYSKAMETPFFKMEDVFMGLCAKKANITLSNNPAWPDFNMRNHYSYCLYFGYLVIHNAAADLRWRFWKELRSPKQPKCTYTGWDVFDNCPSNRSDPAYTLHDCETINNWIHKP